MENALSKLSYIEGTKIAIKNAIISKGTEIGDDVTFRQYADKIIELNVVQATVGTLSFTSTYKNLLIEGTTIRIYNSLDELVGTLVSTKDTAVTLELPVGIYWVDFYTTDSLAISEVILNDLINNNNQYDSSIQRLNGINISHQTSNIQAIVNPVSAPQLIQMDINNGDVSSSSSLLDINILLNGIADEYMISEYSDFLGAVWQSYTGQIQYTRNYISDIEITLYLKLRNDLGESEVLSDSIMLINGVLRSDNAKTYRSIKDAYNDIVLDYDGNLSTDVTIYSIGNVKEIRDSGLYWMDITDFNLNSSHLLTIDGFDLVTIDCKSLGGIRIRSSYNILIKNINFINVGTKVTASAPEELSAVLVQGNALEPCGNILLKKLNIDCKETFNNVTKRGNYGLIASNTNNYTVLECTLNYFQATGIKCEFVDIVNLSLNFLKGEQTRGIISQPCHVSVKYCSNFTVTDNEFNGLSFDTGIITDSPKLFMSRNKLYNFGGEILRQTNSVKADFIEFSSNILYENVINPAYPWVKNITIFTDTKILRFISNTIVMGGDDYYGYNQALIRAWQSTIDNLYFSNNIIIFYYPNHSGNVSQASVLSIGDLGYLESKNNIYIDDIVEPDTLKNFITVPTNSTSQVTLEFVKILTTIQNSGYEQDSKVMSLSTELFNNLNTKDFTLSASSENLARSVSGIISQYDHLYRTADNTTKYAGAYFYTFNLVDENDTGLDYTAINMFSNEEYSNADTIIAYSKDNIFLETKNINRSVVLFWSITNAESNKVLNILGRSGLIQVFSNLKPDGTYLSDATYTITKLIK